VKISAVICTHNPRRDYLERTLESLRGQDLAIDQWELIVVDNHSPEPVSGHCDLSWHPQGRVVVERELGLTPARLRGLAEAAGEIIVFADDDNVLSPDYLRQVLAIFAEQPRLGCIGAGILRPEFESEPLPETRPYLSYLALREMDRDVWGNQITGWIPWGAGLAVRKAVGGLYRKAIARSALGISLDRKGDSLISGGDDEFSHVAVAHGWGVGVFTALEITHLIGSKRLAVPYLERLLEANGATRAMLARLHGEWIQPPRPAGLGQLFFLVGKVPLRALLKACFGYATLARGSRFDRHMARLQFKGWMGAVAEAGDPA
jgi:glycosyltransferase involved in cell wall biosynthesis